MLTIVIYGLGYVGLTSAACLYKEGHTIIGIDTNPDKVKQINGGICPISEPQVPELIGQAVRDNKLKCYAHFEQVDAEIDVAIVCVGTPSSASGAHNMSYIAEVTRQIASTIGKNRTTELTVIYRSTFRPGTIDEMIVPIFKSMLKHEFSKINIVYNPEFLRESVAVDDYFDPPKVVVGLGSDTSNSHIEELYKNIDSRIFYVKYREAEFVKFHDNSFHALKVAFANEIGRIASSLDLDVSVLHEIFISDTKLNISPYYFRPGTPFGGSCLPKDVRALQFVASNIGMKVPLIESLIQTNELHKRYLFDLVSRNLAKGSSILMIGLAFKTLSDDLRESPHIDLARSLMQAGYHLSIFDPYLKPEKLLGQNLGYAYSHLPTLADILIDEEGLSARRFDLVVNANGSDIPAALADVPLVDIWRIR